VQRATCQWPVKLAGDVVKPGHLPEPEPFSFDEMVIHRCIDGRPVTKLEVLDPFYG
jgi:hypothetical protein